MITEKKGRNRKIYIVTCQQKRPRMTAVSVVACRIQVIIDNYLFTNKQLPPPPPVKHTHKKHQSKCAFKQIWITEAKSPKGGFD